MEFICYPRCSTCQKARKWLKDKNFDFEERDIKENTPSKSELREWFKRSGLPLKKFFNTSGMLYKEMHLKDTIPALTEEEQLELLSSNGMLIKRPLLIAESFVLLGFKEAEWTETLITEKEDE